jgi:putative DNA primase/helicase
MATAQRNGWNMPVTYEVQTGSGKSHFYFKYPGNGKEYGNKGKAKTQGFDIRGIGGCVVAPGSIHPDTGRPYIIEKDVPLADAPAWLLAFYDEPVPTRDESLLQNVTDIESLPISEKHRAFLITGNPKGYSSRSEALFACLCAMIAAGISEQSTTTIVESCPGGEKFREKGRSRLKWLRGEIARATIYINTEHPEDQRYMVSEKIKAGEVGIAQLIVMLWRNKLRYDIREGRWYLWGTHFWKRVSDERVMESFEPLVNLFGQYILETAQSKIEFIGKDKTKVEQLEALEKVFINALKIIGDVSRRMEILKLCRSEGAYLGFDGAWDENPYLIACSNGVLNIDTGNFRDGRPEDNIRTAIMTPWNPAVPCPTWEDALFSIFDENKDVLNYVQRVWGYCTSGLNIHHILWILEGKGRNGKGLIYRALYHVLDGFITYVDRELLLERKHGRQSGAPAPDVLTLHGKRMAFMLETAENRKFDPGKMKWLTGGDIVSARGLYAKDITTFKSTAKIFLLTNFRPHISGGDYAAWQRIVLLPFPVSFVPEPSTDKAKNERLADPHIEERIHEEASGILAWLVEGYRKYKAQGINAPDCVREATREYHKEEDVTAKFVEEKIENYLGNLLPAGECYKAFQSWCEEQGIHPKHNSVFGREIRLHVEAVTKNKKVFYANVKLQ